MLMADIIEHLPRENAKALVAQTVEQCHALIISTPANVMEQSDLYGNEHKRHHIVFSANDFSKQTHAASFPCTGCNVFFASCQPISKAVIPGRLYRKGLSVWKRNLRGV